MRGALFVLACGLALDHAGAAWGQDKQASCDEAAQLVDKGQVAFNNADYAVALEYFSNAYRKCPQPNLQFNIALALDKLKRTAEAVEMYDAALAEADGADADTRAWARDRMTELEKTVGTLVVTSQPAGAQVAVDGKSRGKTPLPRSLRVAPGQHRVTVSMTNRKPFAVDVDVAAGETKMVEADLPVIDLGVGPTPTAPRSFTSRHKWSLIAAGTAIVFAGAGAGFGYWTYKSYGDLSSTCAGLPPDGCAQSDIDAVEQKALATNVLFGVACAAAVTSAVLFFFVDQGEERSPGVAVVPTPSGAALSFHY